MSLIELDDHVMTCNFSVTPDEMEAAVEQVRSDFVSQHAPYSFTAARLYLIWQRTVSRDADSETYEWFCNFKCGFFEDIDRRGRMEKGEAHHAWRRSQMRRRANGEITFLTFARVVLNLEADDHALAQQFANAMEWIDAVFGGEDDLDPEDIAYNIDFMGGFDLTSDGSFSNLPSPENWAARRLALEQVASA